MSIELVMLSNHLILCCPLLLSSFTFLSIRVFSSKLALGIRWPKYWSFSFSISPSNECSGLISFRIDQRAGQNSWDWGWDEFLGSSGGARVLPFSVLCLKTAHSLRQSQVSASPITWPFEAHWPPYPQICFCESPWVTEGVPQGVRGLKEKPGYVWDKDHLFHTIWESYLWVESSGVGGLSHP